MNSNILCFIIYNLIYKRVKETLEIRKKMEKNFGLNKQFPSMTNGKVMLVAYMQASDKLVCVTASTCADTQVSVVVSSSCHTRLVGYSESVTLEIPPE